MIKFKIDDIEHETLCYKQKIEINYEFNVNKQSPVLVRCNKTKNHIGKHSWEEYDANTS